MKSFGDQVTRTESNYIVSHESVMNEILVTSLIVSYAVHRSSSVMHTVPPPRLNWDVCNDELIFDLRPSRDLHRAKRNRFGHTHTIPVNFLSLASFSKVILHLGCSTVDRAPNFLHVWAITLNLVRY